MAKIDTLRRFALWDIDGTMSKEITHFKLVEYLVKMGLFTQEMADVTKGYLNDYQLAKKGLLEYEYTYEQFINDLLISFAQGLAGCKASDVQKEVSNFFVDNQGEMFYPYVKSTMVALKEEDVESVLVTGNTQFTVKAVASLFGVQEDRQISSIIGVNDDGYITGNLTTALAESSQKVEAIKGLIKGLGKVVVVAAFGDSSGDVGMLELAKFAFGINNDGNTPSGLNVVEGLLVPTSDELNRLESLLKKEQLV